MLFNQRSPNRIVWALPILLLVFFISGFTALLYQVVWQRMLGLFSGSDVRSVSIVVASYLAGLGLGSLIGGWLSDRLSRRWAVQTYGLCSLAIAIFALGEFPAVAADCVSLPVSANNPDGPVVTAASQSD
jgi:spermidine synthase